jgi:hypothetical protein
MISPVPDEITNHRNSYLDCAVLVTLKSYMNRSTHSAKSTASQRRSGWSRIQATFAVGSTTGLYTPSCHNAPEAGGTRPRPGRVSERTLEAAFFGFKPFRRLITICAWCQKTRNSSGGWQRMAARFQSEAALQLTHGICPACAEHEFAAYRALTSVMNGAHAVPTVQ